MIKASKPAQARQKTMAGSIPGGRDTHKRGRVVRQKMKSLRLGHRLDPGDKQGSVLQASENRK